MTSKGTYSSIVLAAGFASRFGMQKLLAPLGRGIVLDGALRVAFAAPVSEVIVVTGSENVAVGEAARLWAQEANQTARLQIVLCEDYASGLSTSLRAGLSAISPSIAGTFIFLGDMPRVPDRLPAELRGALEVDGAAAAAPTHEGRRGHPVLLSRILFPRLHALQGDRGATRVLDELGTALSLVPCDDPGIFADIDTPRDLTAIDIG